jgi:predicted signal transduction protein with EAL and GGDEF domain
MIARLGGDEFMVLLENIHGTDDTAHTANNIIAEMAKPFHLLDTHVVHIGVSVGISIYGQHGITAQTLIDHADAALYKAKGNGRNCFAYFSEELTLAARQHLELEAELRTIIEQGELNVYYQAQVNIATGKIIGAEALVRWKKPINGFTSVQQFIQFAEENGFINSIGEWVLRETCRQGKQWLDAGLPPVLLAVNVSPYQFQRSDVVNLVETVLRETHYPAQYLELELTESGLMQNQKNTRQLLQDLRALGIKLAIDDFGTGYSSLAYLKLFPINTLKIDRSFIQDIPNQLGDMAIAATIIAMGHILGFDVLAEGVETSEQLAFLREKGCDSYQGYIKSRPVPANEFVELLKAETSC